MGGYELFSIYVKTMRSLLLDVRAGPSLLLGTATLLNL